MKSMFSLHHLLTCKPSTNLSNPCNKPRGKNNVKEVFLSFLHASFIPASFLPEMTDQFYDFRFKSTATAGIGIHPTKAWLSELVNFKNAIWTWGHIWRTIYNQILYKLGKNTTEMYEMLQTAFELSCMNQFLSGIRDSRKPGSLLGMMRGVGGVRKSIHQRWLAKGFGLGLLHWGFKGIQEEIPSEEASTLQIGSGAFPPGQCTSPQHHPCHRLFDQDGHQDRSSASI